MTTLDRLVREVAAVAEAECAAQRRRARQARRRQRRCFWSRPIGHVWFVGRGCHMAICPACGKTKWRW